ncbi:hybrid sensor histidine kinase/response regulator [Desulforhopalus sp. 52FAK]
MSTISSTFLTSKNFFYPLVAFVITFIVVAALYINYQNQEDRDQFSNHAAIISDDIWALNEIGASTYLKLAMKANHYASINVSIPGDEDFLELHQAPLRGFTHFLHTARLIRTKELSLPILYNDNPIGTLTAVQYVRIIFPLVNILLVLLLILLTTIIIISLFVNRRHLEHEVEERTKNLKNSEQRYHDLVNFLPEIVLETDIDGNITYANQVAIELLDSNFTIAAEKCFIDLLAESDRYDARKNFYASLQGNPIELQEYSIIGSDNTLFPVLLKIAPLIIDDIQVAGARMIAIDISSRRHLEEQLLRDQKMKAIGLMAGGVAHDLNNILSGIISYPDLLLLDLPEDHRFYKPLTSIRRSGMDAAEVVSDLLTVARGVAASTEVTSLNDLIRHYLESPDFKEILSKNPHVRIIVQLDPELGNVDCSAIHVRKCLMNIINNGVEAIKGKGSLTISSVNDFCTLPAASQTKGLSSPRNPLRKSRMFSKIIVNDTGEGIDDKEIQHIFEPFYSTKVMGRSGTGLGLTIVWNTMQDHDGTVQVTSSKAGTTFELFFPSIDSEVKNNRAKKDWKDYLGSGQSILVVDDEPRQREILSSLLNSLQYKVFTVSSGEAAEEFLESNTVDLLVLDMIMSPGQNGRITYENILKIHPQQRAVIASGFAKDDDVQATLKLGASEFIAKPYTIEQIGGAIYKTLQS